MYQFKSHKCKLFSEEGQVMFLKIRDKANALLTVSGCFRMSNVFTSGDVWDMMACVDRLVELGEIKEVIQKGNVAGQDRIFTK